MKFTQTNAERRQNRLKKISWHRLFSVQLALYTYTHCFSLIGAKIKIGLKLKKIDNFVSYCSKYTVQPFGLEVLMSSLERYPSWKITIPMGYASPGEEWGPLRKQKLYIDWIYLFQSKILNFAMIGFHQISLSTFIRNFALYCNVKKFEKFE